MVNSEDDNNSSRSSNSNNNSNNENWLGFSLLSPNEMKMGHVVVSGPETRQRVGFLSNQSLNSDETINGESYCFDNVVVGGGESGGYLSHSGGGGQHELCVMPLKSDGSLCIMEALSISHPPPQEPKPEKLTGEQQQTMALSLDSIYYNQPVDHETTNRHNFDAYFSLFGNQGLYKLSDHQDYLLRNWQHHQHQHDISSTGLIDQINSDSINNSNNVYGHRGHAGNGNNVVTGVGCGDHFQSLSLSMSPGSQSSCVTAADGGYGLIPVETKKRGIDKVCQKQTVHRKSIDTFGQRTSQYRGVTKHRWTGRYEAHLWDNSCKKEGQTRKGRQVYLGGYDMEEKAARAYDLAALKYWGLSTHTNFPIENYKKEIEDMKPMSRQEFVAHLRRKSSGFSRGASMYRGVTRHHQHGRWQARIGRVAGNKDLYLGTFSTQEEAAEAYDVAAIKFRGVNAVTNFDISRYDVDKILASNTLLAGENARKSKVVDSIEVGASNSEKSIVSTYENNATNNVGVAADPTANALEWKMMGYHHHSHGPQQSYGNSNSFSLGLHDVVGVEIASPVPPPMAEDSTKLGSNHFSNGSSLVTSLHSSREGSPERNGNQNMNGNETSSSFSPMVSKFVSPNSIANAWIPTTQFRPPNAIPTMAQAHLSVFATAWGET